MKVRCLEIQLPPKVASKTKTKIDLLHLSASIACLLHSMLLKCFCDKSIRQPRLGDRLSVTRLFFTRLTHLTPAPSAVIPYTTACYDGGSDTLLNSSALRETFHRATRELWQPYHSLPFFATFSPAPPFLPRLYVKAVFESHSLGKSFAQSQRSGMPPLYVVGHGILPHPLYRVAK